MSPSTTRRSPASAPTPCRFVRMVRTRYLPAVVRLCPGADTHERLAALIDFAFNLGPVGCPHRRSGAG